MVVADAVGPTLEAVAAQVEAPVDAVAEDLPALGDRLAMGQGGGDQGEKGKGRAVHGSLRVTAAAVPAITPCGRVSLTKRG